MSSMRKLGRAAAIGIAASMVLQASVFAGETEYPIQNMTETEKSADVEDILSGMSLDEKISQMIIPAIRSWDGNKVTDLNEARQLKEALNRHQYGGIILFGDNVTGTGQVVRLVSDLQENNLENEDVSTHIPYLTPVDQEGGIVSRLTTGTRMTGSMAIGATGTYAAQNARLTGEIIGEEMKAVGFNVDFAPDIDVNSNPANPVIGTRSFSDDPDTVSALSAAYAEGLAENNIVATYKHFPGHGDTGTDSHIGTATVEKTYDELQECDLIPFKAAIDNGADMIMTAHITLPLVDDEVTFGDGKTTGYYPATMSKKLITDILRGDLGFDGVVVTDALEMDAIRTAKLVPGEEGSVEYGVGIAEKVINAGVDILLIPTDLMNKEAAAYYDDYISGISELVEDGTIPGERIDESVTRILELKEEYGILDPEEVVTDQDEAVRNAEKIVGSDEHHAVEMEIARQAVTMLKNDDDVLPLSDSLSDIVILGRMSGEENTINYAVDNLRADGWIGRDTDITVDYYYQSNDDGSYTFHYSDETKEAVKKAGTVIMLSCTYGSSVLDKGAAQYEAISTVIEDTHAAGGKFVLLSDNLPYDAARYQDADAIILAYMAAGLTMDPAKPEAEGADRMAYNANVIAALETIFGGNKCTGTLPVNVPAVEEKEDGTAVYTDSLLYERGFGLE